jgi:hypothetical protein
MELFDREKLMVLPLNQRFSKSSLDIMIDPDKENNYGIESLDIEYIARALIDAKNRGSARILSFGAHLIKNGLSLYLIKMIEEGYFTHLATNGAGSIHDWEFAFQGKTEEDVRENIKEGKFGIWDETGKYINLALIVGANSKKGYGESIAEMINSEKLNISDDLYKDTELCNKLKNQNITPGYLNVEHKYKKYSIQNATKINNVRFTVHPGFGYDIIYTHPMSDGASVGKSSEIDFLKFADSVSRLEGGVYLSVGSAIMSPMIFEKALSMARNQAIKKGEKLNDFIIGVNDIQKAGWDFEKTCEPSKDNPNYYNRFCKSFDRMGSKKLYFVNSDNRDFLIGLYKTIKRLESQ